ncbi:RNA polymerase sigma-70 factor [Maribellus maritimus]|uniref:RNA polymerase sigma-70 factor n=1 Tax=Maribellus maritimus TaxID=2870838 RepID=UPI001EEBB14D|nr:RNA polymerase sigma-70 factor [Maribellus maritimus]MCG6190041.1 RNA polymerase sigma-70 factor [Maribellus maritimus]
MKITESEFQEIYNKYFKALCLVSFRCLNNRDEAEDVVQQVFLDFYEHIETKTIQGDVYAYLKKAVYYKSIDVIKKEKSQNKYFESLTATENVAHMENLFDSTELEKTIYEVVDELPEQCRVVFVKSRYEGKSNKEIAAEYNISVRTVEAHIFKALKRLKTALKDHLLQLLFTFF